MTVKERRAKTVKAIRCLVSSFDSHLDSAVDTEKRCEWCGGRAFHAKTAKEYAEAIKDLVDTLR